MTRTFAPPPTVSREYGGRRVTGLRAAGSGAAARR